MWNDNHSYEVSPGSDEFSMFDLENTSSFCNSLETKSSLDRSSTVSFEEWSSAELKDELDSINPSCEIHLQLRYESVASYFRKLLKWRQGHTSPLFGEHWTDEALVCSTTVFVMCNSANIYYLTVSGQTYKAVERRAYYLSKMIDDIIRNRQIHELPGWQNQHRLAIFSSEVSDRQQDVTRTYVQFHFTGAITRTEIVALQPHQHNSMLRFLRSLKPRESVWEVSLQDVVKYNTVSWESLSKQHAVYCQWISVHNTGGVLFKVWGFEPGLDEGVRLIRETVGAIGPVTDSDRTSAVVSPLNFIAPPHAHEVSRLDIPCAPQKTVRPFSTSYTFRDREAGIFFYAFEKAFRDYMAQTFDVTLDDVDKVTQVREGRKRESFDERSNSMLKVTMHGTTQNNVASARNYLEQLNPMTLTRVQVFYPQVHSTKYKELCNKRTQHQSELNAIRLNATSVFTEQSAAVDPMKSVGFVNIRIKPPMHTNYGVRRMPLPADCTITICNSSCVAEHNGILRDIEQSFAEVGSEYVVGSVSVSASHPLRKQLTIKSQREQFVAQHNLVALKWEEGSRQTGSVGITTMWASSHDALSRALTTIQAVEQTNWKIAEDCSGFKALASPATQCVNNTERMVLSSLLSHDMSTGHGVGRFESIWGDGMSPATPQAQSVVYWPDLALRYVLLSDPLSGMLNDILYRQYAMGVSSKYPYRDRTNPRAGILLQGDSEGVAVATRELNIFLQDSASKLQSVQVVMSQRQYAELVANELANVKYIQGQSGVRITLGAKHQDIENSVSSQFDLRLTPGRTSAQTDPALLTVRATLSISSHSVEITVISNRTSAAGWTWGVNTLLVIVDSDSLPGLRQDEAEHLHQGKVLVHSDHATGKTILRVMSRDPLELYRAQQQASELLEVIARGLTAAEERGLTGVAVAAPVDCPSFTALEKDSIRSLTVEAVVEYCKDRNLRHLTRIVCIEIAQESHLVKSDMSLLLAPGMNDPMARTMIMLLEQQNKRQYVSPGNTFESVITLIDATVPLPLSFGSSNGMARYNRNRQSFGEEYVLIRGLPCGVLKSIEMLSAPLLPRQVSPETL